MGAPQAVAISSTRFLLEKWKEAIKQQVAQSKVTDWLKDVLLWCL